MDPDQVMEKQPYYLQAAIKKSMEFTQLREFFDALQSTDDPTEKEAMLVSFWFNLKAKCFPTQF